MKSRILTCILCVVSLATFAQDTTMLTFQEAIQLALRNNVTLNTQKNTLNQSRVLKTAGWAGLGPQASINASLYQSNGNRFIQQEGKVVNATVNGAQAGLSVTQPIFGGLSGINNARASAEAFDAQVETVRRSEQDAINNVAVQFLQVLLDQELVKIAEENLNFLQAQLEQVKAQVELGSRSPVDEYSQQALVSNADMRLQQAIATLTGDRTLLLQTLLIDPTLTIRIEEPAWDLNAIAIDNPDFQAMVSTALDKRSDLKAFRHLEKSSRLSMHASRGGYMPYLSAFYNNGSAYNQVKGADQSDPGYRNFNQQFFTDNRSNSFGLSLYVPIFTGFQNRVTYMRNKVLYENNQLLTQRAEVVVKGDVQVAYQNFLSLKQAYTAGMTGLEASKMAFGLEKERYNLGITSFVDLANATKTYVQAQTDMAQAKYRFLFQKVVLDYVTGVLRPESVPH